MHLKLKPILLTFNSSERKKDICLAENEGLAQRRLCKYISSCPQDPPHSALLMHTLGARVALNGR